MDILLVVADQGTNVYYIYDTPFDGIGIFVVMIILAVINFLFTVYVAV